SFAVILESVAFLSAVLLPACAKDETSIFLTVTTELMIPEEMDTLRIVISEAGTELYSHDYTLKPGQVMTLAILPGRDEEYTIHMVASALKEGSEVCSGEADATFAFGKNVDASIRLLAGVHQKYLSGREK
ncbi:MAG: hypothetical protein WC889_06885, partial [Myxococcota bacterium]